MGGTSSTEMAANDVGEVNNSSGFHFLELHLPSVSFSVGLTILIVIIIFALMYCCKKQRRNKRHFLPTYQMHPMNQMHMPPQMAVQHLWETPYNPYIQPPIRHPGFMPNFQVPVHYRERQRQRDIDDGRIEEVNRDEE